MAGTIVLYYRNYNSSDTMDTGTRYMLSEPCPTIDTIGWSAPSGKSFKEWNTSRDGSGTSINPGTTYFVDVSRYAIWQDADPTKYLTNDQEITSIADAIRAKGGTSASFVYPTGFVSAINNINTGTDVSDTTATSNDVLSGKYFYTAAGVKTQGNITTQAAQTITPTTTDQTITSGKYLTGAQTIKGDANLVAENIAEGITIFGVVGTHTGGTSYPEAAGNYFGTELITFTVDFSYITLEGNSLISYNAWPGMTWGDFVNSKYNDDFRINPFDLMVLHTKNVPLHYNDSYVYQNDLIIPNATYYVYYGSSGGSAN